MRRDKDAEVHSGKRRPTIQDARTDDEELRTENDGLYTQRTFRDRR